MDSDNRVYFSILIGVIFSLNSVIGVGIFEIPLNLYYFAGPAGLLTIIIGALCFLTIGISFSRIAYINNGNTDMFVIASAWGGKVIGIITSLSYICGLTFALGILTRSVTNIISLYITNLDISYIAYMILIGIFIATLFASSIARTGQIILFILTILPLFIIAFLSIKHFDIIRFFPFFRHDSSSVFLGLPTILFSFLGFESISSLSHYFKNPKLEIPLVTLFTIIITALIYLLFVGVIIGGIESSLLLNKKTLAEVLFNSFPHYSWIIHFMNLSIIVTIFGTMYSIILGIQSLLIKSVKNIFPSVALPEIISVVTVIIGAFLSYSTFKGNNTYIMKVVCFLVTLSYCLSIIFLIVRPEKKSDFVLGVFGLFSIAILFYSVFK